MVNTGSISTTGTGAEGIRSLNSNIITNSGTVNTHGTGADGMYAKNYNTITNSGKIATTNTQADGIDVLRFNTIVNSGTIETAGDNADGIEATDNNEITNSGTIYVTGANAKGIFVTVGGDTTITNSGKVVATQGDAIQFRGSDNTFNLSTSSFIGGRMSLGTSTELNLQATASHSVLWDFSTGGIDGGTPNFSGPVPWFYDATTKQYATYDPTGLAGAVNGLGDMTSLLSMVGRNGLGGLNGTPSTNTSGFVSSYLPSAPATDINQRIDQAVGDDSSDPADGSVYAADLNAADMAYAHGRFWITGFGGQMEYEGDSMTLGHNIDQMGVAAGYTWQQGSGLTLGVLAGYIKSHLDVDSPFTISHDIESHGWLAGLYGEQQMGAFTLDFGVNGGVLSHDSSRFLNDNLAPLGVSYANADYDSWFISPEAGIRTDINTGNGLFITPSARIRYAQQSIDGYSETGSNANAIVDDRDIAMLEASAEIAVTKQVNFGTITGSIGYLTRHASGDDAVSITMLGINNSVGFGNTDSEAATLGLAADISLTANSKLTLDTKAYFSGNMQGYQGMAKWVTRF